MDRFPPLNPASIPSTSKQLDWNTDNRIPVSTTNVNYYLQHPHLQCIEPYSIPVYAHPPPPPPATPTITVATGPPRSAQDIYEAEAIKFIQDNNLAIKKAQSRRKSSKDFLERSSRSKDECRRRSRSKSRSRSEIRTTTRRSRDRNLSSRSRNSSRTRTTSSSDTSRRYNKGVHIKNVNSYGSKGVNPHRDSTAATTSATTKDRNSNGSEVKSVSKKRINDSGEYNKRIIDNRDKRKHQQLKPCEKRRYNVSPENRIKSHHLNRRNPVSGSSSSSKVKPTSSSSSKSAAYSKNNSSNNSHNNRYKKKNPSIGSEDGSSRLKKTKVFDSNMNDDKVDSSSSSESASDSELNAVEPWVRSAPAELYYTQAGNGDMTATHRTINICEKFDKNLVQKAMTKRLEGEQLGSVYMAKLATEEADSCNFASDSSATSSDDDSSDDSESGSGSDREEESLKSKRRSDASNRELERRTKHPRRLHQELWHNDPGQMNDGPVCRCSAKARRFGIRHGFYPGESTLYSCAPYSNNSMQLHHYTIIISPRTNLLIKSPTVIPHDGHDYIFEGFSIFSHYKLDLNLPPCRVIRFNIRYCMCIAEEVFPQTFCVRELKLFEKYIFNEILELVDLKIDYSEGGNCSQFHIMPRFVRKLPDNGKEILSMNRVLEHLLKSDKDLIKETELPKLLTIDQSSWQNFADKHKGTIVAKWGMKPCAIRVDQIDRDVSGHETEDEGIPFPLIVHFGIRPPQLSYAGNVEYQRAWRRFVKYRHLLSNMPKPKIEDKRKLLEKDLKLQEMRTRSTMKRDVTVAVSAKGFRTTGICCDLIQHAMLIPVLFTHLRFHKSLQELESRMDYTFNNRYLLQLAMTHPSYRENFGTNPDHARNALTNCGIRQPEYGDRKIHYASSRKRGINTLIDIMARFGMKIETESDITHNERLEFLGDAVVEFVTSIHLFHIFPELEEGGLATYRAAIVQNQHLAVLAQNLGLDQFMLYAHGSDLCHDSELRHAMANCFEALMGALFLDGGVQVWSQIKIADSVFSKTMYGGDQDVFKIWTNFPRHPLQIQEPEGDRHWIESHKALQKITEFEAATGIQFNHIRLLARAFTDRSLGYNNLSRGSNQRLEFLGDTVLQLIASEYLYRFFPDHHEGHLSLLRSSLVNNRTQAVVCDTLGMAKYAMRNDPKSDMKTKDRADLLEAFLGALYIDQGLQSCIVFCSVCFFPRLEDSIVNQDWNDPKSKLQQCCLTLRSMDGKEPEIPSYKVTEVLGPTNTRVYKVAVYFRNKRLATSRGHSIQEAEMNAASYALVKRDYLFPQLKHQKRLLEKTTKQIPMSAFHNQTT